MHGIEPLGPDEVHLWYAFSDEMRDAATLARCAGMLSPDERARHDRFVFEKDRHQFLLTRGMIRTLVARYVPVDPAACAFVSDRYGRPSLSHPADADLAFNLSHTAGLIVCALAREPEIGVDAEDVGRSVDRGLARRFFSPIEADALDALPEADRQERFYEYWTLKEAYIKARGMGLSLPLDAFSMDLDEGRAPRIRFMPEIEDEADSWQFAQFHLSPRHVVALAQRRRGADRAIHIRPFPVAALQ